MAEGATAPRRAALEALRLVRGGELADRALERAAASLPPRDHGWAQELVYGTFRLRGRIDFLLQRAVRGGLDALEPDVLDVLRLGVYQLLEMGSVPPYAAVSQSVELARAAGAGRASGLVNGVLQTIRRAGKEAAPPDPGEPTAEFLSTWGSHPRWLVERWIARWGAADAAALVEADNRRPELFLRPVGLPAGEAVARLRAAGIAAEEVPGFPDSIRIDPPHGPREALAVVPAVVQDPAAAQVVRYAAPPEGGLGVDLCAAPGGKAMGLAGELGYVAAADLSIHRLRRVLENVERLGARGRLGAVVADARHPPFRPVDFALLDAPCTGTGTLRRHPDGRWRVGPADLGALAALQAELLDAAAPCIRPGGLLVYATCSLEEEENEAQVAAFLARHPQFFLDSPGGFDREMLNELGHLSVLPQRHGVDGAFAARLRRAA